MRRGITLLGLVLLAVIPSAAMVWGIWVTTRGGEPEPEEWIPATSVSLQPVVRVEVSVEFGPGRSLTYFGQRGRVVEVLLDEGATLEAVSPLFVVGQSTVFGYASERPLFRMLGSGDRGWDVEVLKGFLRMLLDLDLPADDRLDRPTTLAIRSFSRTYIGTEASTFNPDWLIWYPMGAGQVDSLDVQVGDVITETSTIGSILPKPLTVSILPSSGGDFPDAEELDLLVDGQVVAKFHRSSPAELLDSADFVDLAEQVRIGGSDTIGSASVRPSAVSHVTMVPGAAVRATDSGFCVVVLDAGIPTPLSIEVGETGQFGGVEIRGLSTGELVLLAPVAEVDRLCSSN